MIGTTVQNRYRIEKLLGEGGFGAVYRAEDLKLERKVALKILNHIIQKNPEHVRRFIDEAKVTSKLSHRNIPVVYEYGESENGTLFIVTELFVGSSLEEIIELRALSPRQASWITSEVNEALIVAHQQNITHRDVKPPNIYIHQGSAGEEVKLLDFGIAKLSNQSYTLTGQLFGTPYFMSPEQILGRKDITPSADLYSLGAMLFYCLTRRVPFDGESQFVIFNKHVNASVPHLVDYMPQLQSPRLQELLELLLQKNPDHRPQSALEARKIFIEISNIIEEIDILPRQPISHAVTSSLLEERIQEPTAVILPHLPPDSHRGSTQVDYLLSVPKPLDLSDDEESDFEELELSEVITEAPLDDSSWRPTQRLAIDELRDALHESDQTNTLLDDDDTTDNVRRDQTSSQSSTPLSKYSATQAFIPDTALYQSNDDSYARQQITSRTPLDVFESGERSREATRVIFDHEDLTASHSPKYSFNQIKFHLIAGVVFIVGLWMSLNLFEDSSTLTASSTHTTREAVSAMSSATTTHLNDGELRPPELDFEINSDDTDLIEPHESSQLKPPQITPTLNTSSSKRSSRSGDSTSILSSAANSTSSPNGLTLESNSRESNSRESNSRESNSRESNSRESKSGIRHRSKSRRRASSKRHNARSKAARLKKRERSKNQRKRATKTKNILSKKARTAATQSKRNLKRSHTSTSNAQTPTMTLSCLIAGKSCGAFADHGARVNLRSRVTHQTSKARIPRIFEIRTPSGSIKRLKGFSTHFSLKQTGSYMIKVCTLAQPKTCSKVKTIVVRTSPIDFLP